MFLDVTCSLYNLLNHTVSHHSQMAEGTTSSSLHILHKNTVVVAMGYIV
jgi:hypothetical protein